MRRETATSSGHGAKTFSQGGAPPAKISVSMTWDWALAVGTPVRCEAHSHYPTEVVIGLDAPIELELRKGREYRIGRGFVVGSNTRHRVFCRSSSVATFLTGPLSSAGRRLSSHLGQAGAKQLPDGLLGSLVSGFESMIGQPSRSRATALIEELLDRIEATSPRPSKPDGRVLEVMECLREGYTECTPVGDLARTVGVSEGHLCHLFKRDVGMPIRTYRRWLRLRFAVKGVLEGNDLTWASHDAAFSDQAEFSRVFRSAFGFPPSKIKSMDVTINASKS